MLFSIQRVRKVSLTFLGWHLSIGYNKVRKRTMWILGGDMCSIGETKDARALRLELAWHVEVTERWLCFLTNLLPHLVHSLPFLKHLSHTYFCSMCQQIFCLGFFISVIFVTGTISLLFVQLSLPATYSPFRLMLLTTVSSGRLLLNFQDCVRCISSWTL